VDYVDQTEVGREKGREERREREEGREQKRRRKERGSWDEGGKRTDRSMRLGTKNNTRTRRYTQTLVKSMMWSLF